MYNDNIENIKLAQDGIEQAMENLVKKNSGLVWNIVKRFSGRGIKKRSMVFKKKIPRSEIRKQDLKV